MTTESATEKPSRFFARPEVWTVIYRLVVVSLLAFIAWSVADIPDQELIERRLPIRMPEPAKLPGIH
jgi:ABC-type amino acid transport system permease subunit